MFFVMDEQTRMDREDGRNGQGGYPFFTFRAC